MPVSELIPWWVPWLGPALFLVVFVSCVLLVPGFVLNRVSHRIGDQPWTERALLASEGRFAIAIGLFLWPILTVIAAPVYLGPFTPVPTGILVGVVVALVILTIILLGRGFSTQFGQPVSSLGDQLWRSFRIYWPYAGLITIGFAAPNQLDSFWMVPWAILAVAALLGLRYLIDLYVETGVAAPATGALSAAVTRAANKCGVKIPRTFVLTSNAINAVALPGRNIIVVTERMAKEFNEDELEAVVLHEIAHIEESRSVTARRTISTLLLLPLLALRPLLAAGWVYLVGAVLLIVGVQIASRKVFAAEELRADINANQQSHQSTVFGESLLKMHQIGLIPAYVKRDPHGHLYDRLRLAGVTPDFERLERGPRRFSIILAFALAATLILATSIIPAFAVDIYDGKTGSNVALAFGWSVPSVLSYNGYLKALDGDFESATIYLEEAARLGDESALVELAWVYGASGNCDEATAVWERLAESDVGPDDVAFARFWVEDCHTSASG